MEPDGVYLLEGGSVHFRLMETGVNADGKTSVSELNVTSEKAEYKFEVKEEEYLKFDPKSSNATALQEGETTVRFKQVNYHNNFGLNSVRLGLCVSLTWYDTLKLIKTESCQVEQI